MIYVLGIIILIIFIILIFIFFKFIKLKDIREALDISIIKVEDILKEKLDLVNTLLKDVKDEKIKSKFKYKDDDSLVDREDSLFDISFNINKYFKDNSNKSNDKIKTNIHKLNILEEELDGLKDFYNANILDYNEIYLKKYLNKIFKFLKFNEYKPFKIRKLEEYEIFKN